MPKRDRSGDVEASEPALTESRPQHVRKLSTPPPPAVIITCDIPPICNAVPFTSYDEYETHYSQLHTNRCSECHHNFPSQRYLEVHIRECHDQLAQVRKERGERIYECYVDGCDKVCISRARRKLHLIDKHGFPKDFYWAVIDKGLDNRKTLLNTPELEFEVDAPQHSVASTAKAYPVHLPIPSNNAADKGKTNAQADVDAINNLMGSLKLVPRSVQLRKQ